MPNTDQALTTFLGSKDSTHDENVVASAAHLVLALRHDFSGDEECDLTEAEHAFLRTPALVSIHFEQGPPLDWDETYPNLRGIFAFIRAVLPHPCFNLPGYKKVCHNIMRLAEMRKDHWSTKKYYENGEGKEIKPSMGEVINLVSHGVLNNEAFDVTAKGAEADRLDRLAVLFDLFLNVPDVCSTGLSNEFLFVVDGYRGVRIIELLSGFINNLALIFVAKHLREDYQKDPQALYTLVLGHFSESNTHYEAWLDSKKEALQAYLESQVSLLKLNKAACDKAVIDFMGALDYLDMPTDINQPVIGAMAYLFDDYALNKTLKSLPAVLDAVGCVRSVFEKLNSLEAVAAFGVLDFYRAIELIQECVHFQRKHCLISGAEVGQTQTSLTRLMLLLLSYFESVSVLTLTPEQLMLSKEMDQAAVSFHDDVRQYEFGHLIDFVKNFFVLIGAAQSGADQNLLFDKIQGYRDRLLLSDEQLRQWQERNTNLETGELNISPYEINQLIFNALWINPEEWSAEFRKVLNTVLEWLHDDNLRDGLKANVKVAYMDWPLLSALTLVLFMTRQGVPVSVMRHFTDLYPADMSLSDRFGKLCNISEGVLFRVLSEDARPMQGEFIASLKKFDLYYQSMVDFIGKCELTAEQRQSALNVLLDVDVLARDSSNYDTVRARLLSVLCVFINTVNERQRVLDFIYQALDNHLLGCERYLISEYAFSLLSFAEKERFLLRCPEPESVRDIFLQRSHIDPASPRHAVLTQKLKAALTKNRWDAEIDFIGVLDVLRGNEKAKLEWMALHKHIILSAFSVKDYSKRRHLFSIMKKHEYPIRVFFYECVLKGRLRTQILDASSFQDFFCEFPDLREMVEAEIMEELAKDNDRSIPFWSITQLYDALSGPRRETLMRLCADGVFVTKGNVWVENEDLAAWLREVAKQSWEEASQCLTQYSPNLLNAIMRYVFNQTRTSLESPFVIEFLPLCFVHSFKSYGVGKLWPNVYEVLTLFLLFFHLRETFCLSDDAVNEFMRLHLENEGKVLCLSESDIARFVMHALHIPPEAWSVDFKAAFKVILDALKQHLAEDKNTALRAPYCVPEFIYNLSGLLAVANLDMPAESTRRLALLNLGVKSTGNYSAEYNLFTTAYAVNFLCRDDDECHPDDEALRKTFFNLIQGELSHHIRSVSDVVSLLKIEWLSPEQRDLILDIAFEKAGAFALKMESDVYTHDSAFGQLPHLNDDQKERVKQLLDIIHHFDDSKNINYRFETRHNFENHSYYSSAMCFFTQKAKAMEQPGAKFQNTPIRARLV
jgi:hypothetical protein